MEQWFGDQYDVQRMDSLSARIGARNVGVGARWWGCRGQAAQPKILKNDLCLPVNGPPIICQSPPPTPNIENLPTPVGCTVIKSLKKSSRDTVLGLSR